MMEPTNVTYDICRHYMKDLTGVDPALVAKIDGLRRSRNLAGLASCSRHFDSTLHSINDWRALRQVEAFFKKNSAFSTREVCSEQAKQSFRFAEQVCNETNLRLEYYFAQRDHLDPDLRKYMLRMERYISSVLGDYRPFLDALPHLVRVTPGATAHASRKDSLPQLKMRLRLHATRGAFPYLRTLYRWYGFNEPRLVAVDSNRMELVPKNWKTDRTIACEPEGNLPLQLAFDSYAKRRLRRFGIDLRNQSANQIAAKAASVNNDFVTVDFQAASDTISYNTVAWCFPPDWFRFLADVRSPNFRGVFGEGKFAKFSSMGNGSTFTIETLIFAAACRAVGSKRFLVYGDDVIIEKEFYDPYIRLTRFLGFTINAEKSFSDGPFRESCGLDAYRGVDVTPVYIRSVDKRKASLCHLINTLAGIAYPDGHLASYLRQLVADYNLPLVPYQESTISGIWIDPDLALTKRILRAKRVRWRQRAFFDKFQREFKAYVPKTRQRAFVDSRGYYLWFLNKNSQVLFGGPWHLARTLQVTETSSAPIFEHAYVRKWVGWFPPDGIPDHLHWWSVP